MIQKCKNKNCGREFYVRSGTKWYCSPECRPLNHKIVNMVGMKYGKFEVTAFSHTKDARAYWSCLCECGKKFVVEGRRIRRSGAGECGCVNGKKKNAVSVVEEQPVKLEAFSLLTMPWASPALLSEAE